ncbi:CpaD family pilus assembly protein [Sphingomonas sp.]|uniref:CpaD family pilus assembly protein n=1 Tax=Sphingomonas sp. TaxID=28214 RepID=UPI0025E04610|nr:CpaD family pilus assembly protein [Sphingomonas sp.]
MSKPLLLTVLSATLFLPACTTANANRALESVHQPVVSRTDYVFDVATDGSALQRGEAQRLVGWLSTLRLSFGDKVAVDDPSGAAVTARAEIAEVVGRYGMPLADQAPITAAAMAPGTIRVVVSRSTASVPNCPDYSHMRFNRFQSATSSNYGCATNSNLAAMVARPEDLVRGQPGSTTSDPATGNKAIQTLRKAPNTGAAGLKSEGTSGGGAR